MNVHRSLLGSESKPISLSYCDRTERSLLASFKKLQNKFLATDEINARISSRTARLPSWPLSRVEPSLADEGGGGGRSGALGSSTPRSACSGLGSTRTPGAWSETRGSGPPALAVPAHGPAPPMWWGALQPPHPWVCHATSVLGAQPTFLGFMLTRRHKLSALGTESWPCLPTSCFPVLQSACHAQQNPVPRVSPGRVARQPLW